MRGYAFSDQEVDRDVRAVAAAILNGLGEVVAGLSIAGPAYRINREKIIAFRKLVVGYSQKFPSSWVMPGGWIPKVGTRYPFQ